MTNRLFFSKKMREERKEENQFSTVFYSPKILNFSIRLMCIYIPLLEFESKRNGSITYIDFV